VGGQIMLRLLKSFFFDRNFRENRLFRYTVRQFFLNISSQYGSIVASPPIGEAGFSKTARIRPLTGLVQSCQYIQIAQTVVERHKRIAMVGTNFSSSATLSLFGNAALNVAQAGIISVFIAIMKSSIQNSTGNLVFVNSLRFSRARANQDYAEISS
jgi:hypothetical protein